MERPKGRSFRPVVKEWSKLAALPRILSAVQANKDVTVIGVAATAYALAPVAPVNRRRREPITVVSQTGVTTKVEHLVPPGGRMFPLTHPPPAFTKTAPW